MSKISYQRLISSHKKHETLRRQIQAHGNELLSSSKRSIFAMHRGDSKIAEAELAKAREELLAGQAFIRKDDSLLDEGFWHAALEEYCEALLFFDYMTRGGISQTELPTDDPDIVIGGLSDFTGELSRQAVLKATDRDIESVERMFHEVRDVIEFLLKMNLTGSLRNKFDQAKHNLRKIEEVRYECSRRA
jgi:translin